MKKLKLVIIGAALAALAIPATASAAVERCQVTTTVTAPSVTKATFTVFEPAGTKDSFDDVWTSDYEVTVKADDTFEGTGVINGDDVQGNVADNVPTIITGKFDRANNTVSYVAKPADDANTIRWTLDNGKTDAKSQSDGTTNPATAWFSPEGESVGVNFKVTEPVFTTVKGATTTETTEYKNHGEYVSSLGGGKVAAQKCAGMPTNSTQGK